MGLTNSSTGINAQDTLISIEKKHKTDKIIAFAGNPNTGKSTLFNGLTGMHQHTGNWPGKTVTTAIGSYIYHGIRYILVDLPGTYSLITHSAEEEVARDFLINGNADTVVVVCDSSVLERNLNLVFQTQEIANNVLVCCNLIDEATKKGIKIDEKKLSKELNAETILTTATSNIDIEKIKEAIEKISSKPIKKRTLSNDNYKKNSQIDENFKKSEKIISTCVVYNKKDYLKKQITIDKILTSKLTGIPIMILLLAFIFWLTIEGANYPSQLLSSILFKGTNILYSVTSYISMPDWMQSFLIDGIYKVLVWIISVMLPPMAIFFPLFTILEDIGYLPRVAFVMDKFFQKCNACGKQALTMCMGFGCNSAGVIGCRIIDSKRERLIAILTNNLVPCNGRFPLMITLITIFVGGLNNSIFNSFISTIIITLIVLLGIFFTILLSKILSSTILKGIPSSFTLEMPSYRKPQFGQVIYRSILDRTIFVLGRAILIAIPAGAIIWLLANISINGNSILTLCTNFLDPIASLLGLDGVILMAFILGTPANEIVIPIICMTYLATGSLIELNNSDLLNLFIQNGWTWKTVICTILFSLLHWPCATTLTTIKKETGSLKWTLIAALAPLILGIITCLVANIFLSFIFV